MKVFGDQFVFRCAKALVGTFLGVSAVFAHAAVLVEQSPADGGASLQTPTTGGFEFADSFAIGAGTTLSGFRWWGGYVAGDNSAGDDFVLTIYNDLGGSVGSAVLTDSIGSSAVRSSTSLLDVTREQVYLYEYDLSAALPFFAGTYHISIDNASGADWFWLGSNDGDGSIAYRNLSVGDWDVLADTNLSFAILGDRQSQPVPEPAAPALLAAAGLALLAARRRQRR